VPSDEGEYPNRRRYASPLVPLATLMGPPIARMMAPDAQRRATASGGLRRTTARSSRWYADAADAADETDVPRPLSGSIGNIGSIGSIGSRQAPLAGPASQDPAPCLRPILPVGRPRTEPRHRAAVGARVRRASLGRVRRRHRVAIPLVRVPLISGRSSASPLRIQWSGPVDRATGAR